MWFKEQARRRRADTRRLRELEGLATAMDRSQPVLELRPNATVIRANAPFLGLTGYAASEIIGCPHGMFLAEAEVESAAYREFWRALRRGETVTRTTQLVIKGGGAVRVQATYGPVIDMAGRVTRIALFVTDVSDLKIEVVRSTSAPSHVEEGNDEPDRLIAALSEQFRALAAGDLSTRINAVFGGRYGHVRDEFNAAVASLGQVIDDISAAAGGLGESSDAAAFASQILMRGASRQVSDLQAARAALRKSSLAAAGSAEGLRRAADIAAAMRLDAGGSRRAARDAAGAMGDIEQSAVRIQQTVALIDEVVAQAAVLSLIAEMEGARSATQDPGLQIVAEKMRGLAERAAGAVREIKGVAGANSAHVARGARLVDEARASVGGMTSKMAQIDSLLLGLAKTAQEQTLALRAAGDAVGRAGEIAQAHVDRADEAAIVTGRLIDEAEGLLQAANPLRANVTSRPVSRPEPVRSGRHAQAGNAVALAHARIAAYANPGRPG